MSPVPRVQLGFPKLVGPSRLPTGLLPRGSTLWQEELGLETRQQQEGQFDCLPASLSSALLPLRSLFSRKGMKVMPASQDAVRLQRHLGDGFCLSSSPPAPLPQLLQLWDEALMVFPTSSRQL